MVAIVLGATSAKLRFQTLEDNPLFTKLLPSLAPTVEEGYEYWVYVGYDSGDLFYDDAARLRAMNKWFRRNVARACRARQPRVVAKLAMLNFTNVLRKPGPVFNFVAAAALDDGADYIFRVNDDTEIATAGWASKMAGCLASFRPSNLGRPSVAMQWSFQASSLGGGAFQPRRHRPLSRVACLPKLPIHAHACHAGQAPGGARV